MNLRGNDVRHTPVFLAFARIDKDKVSLYTDSSAFSEEITAALAEDDIVLKPYMDVYDELKTLSGENLMYDPVKVNYALSQCVPEGIRVLPSDINEMIPKSVKK